MDGMSILYLLVPLSVVLVFLIGAIFSWALRNGQFEDMEGEGFRILMDDDTPKAALNETQRTIDVDQDPS